METDRTVWAPNTRGHVGWLELFYDLVFVAAVITFSDAISMEPSLGRIGAVDAKTRHVTLKDDAGKEYSFIAEPYVKNLAQVKVGDLVTVQYTEAIAWAMKKDNTMSASSSESMTSAPAGQKPAATVGSKTTVTVTITAIDPTVPTVSFTGPAGNSMTVKVKG